MTNEVYTERKVVRVYLVEEGSQQVETVVDFNLDSNRPPSIRLKENRMEIGYGEWQKQLDGTIELDLVIAGNYWTSSDGGMLRMKGGIRKK